MSWLRLHIPVQHLEITNGGSIGVWQRAQINLRDSNLPATVEVTVRQGKGFPTFYLNIPLTHVTVTDDAATFIGKLDQHTVAGVVFYRNQRGGFLQVASLIPQNRGR